MFLCYKQFNRLVYSSWLTAGPLTMELKQVEEDDGARDEQGLSWLNAVDPSQDVDGVCAEHSQHAHVNVVQNTCTPQQT